MASVTVPKREIRSRQHKTGLMCVSRGGCAPRPAQLPRAGCTVSQRVASASGQGGTLHARNGGFHVSDVRGRREGKPPMQEKASFAPKKSYDHTGFAGMFLDSDTDED